MKPQIGDHLIWYDPMLDYRDSPWIVDSELRPIAPERLHVGGCDNWKYEADAHKPGSRMSHVIIFISEDLEDDPRWRYDDEFTAFVLNTRRAKWHVQVILQ